MGIRLVEGQISGQLLVETTDPRVGRPSVKQDVDLLWLSGANPELPNVAVVLIVDKWHKHVIRGDHCFISGCLYLGETSLLLRSLVLSVFCRLVKWYLFDFDCCRSAVFFNGGE